MPNNMSTVGFVSRTQDDFQNLLMRAATEAPTLTGPWGERVALWSAPVGAVLAVLIAPVENEDGMPLALELDAIALHRSALTPGAVVTLQIAGFAREFTSWPTEQDLREDQDRRGQAMAAQSLIPSGTFDLGSNPDWSPSATALVHGRVLTSAWLYNELGGGRFARLTVATYGMQHDLVVDPQLVGETLPGPGYIVYGNVWLVGRVARVG